MRKDKILALALVVLFSACHVAQAELVKHEGLPNREGVKVDPLGAGLRNPSLPNRKGIDVGIFTVHTALRTDVQFDDNVFLEQKDGKSDVITILNPSAGLEFSMADNDFSLDYDAHVNLFAEHSDDNFTDHRVRGLAEFNLTDYKISVANVYRRFTDRAGSEDANRIPRQNNFLRAAIASTRFEDLDFDIGYTFGVEDFDSGDLIFTRDGKNLTYNDKDRLLNVADFSVGYQVFPKTNFRIETNLGFINYDNTNLNSDSWFTETVAIIEGEPTSKITTDIRGGVKYQDYEADNDFSAEEDFLGGVVGGGFSYKITEDDRLSALLERNVYESVFNRMNYYSANHAGLDYTHFFNDKMTGSLFGYYQLNLYPEDATVAGVTAKRRDHLFGFGSSLRYDIRKWAGVQVKYQYKQRESKFESYDFKDHLITLSGVIGF